MTYKILKDLDFLFPAFAEKIRHLQEDFKEGTGQELLIFETWRPAFRQTELYKLGRSAPGKMVTRSKAYESLHQYGLALDFIVDQKPEIEGIQGPYDPGVDWPYLGKLCQQYDLEWGGNWSWRDYGHVQIKTDLQPFDMLSIDRTHGLLELWNQIKG